MRGRAWAAALAVVLGATSARAQDAPAVPEVPYDAVAVPDDLTGPVTSVRLEPPLEGESPWTRTGLAPGVAFNAARAREALRVALASGTFAEARVSARAVAGGVEVIVRGERRFRVQSLELRGVGTRPYDEVFQVFALRAGAFVTDSTVDLAVARVLDDYRARGFPDASVERQWRETDEPGVRALVVEVREGLALTVDAVRIVGVPSTYESAVREALGVSPGDRADPQPVLGRIPAAARVLRGGGFFAARVADPVFVDRRGDRVTLEVRVDVGDYYTVRWVGVRAFSDADLDRALRVTEEARFDAATLDALTARVKEFYVRRAFLDVEVTGYDAPLGDGRRELRFAVREGAQTFVRTLRFPGHRVLSEATLREAVESALIGELPAEPTPNRAGADDPRTGEGRLDAAHTYVPDVFSGAVRQRIQAHYRELGYLDVEVGSPAVERDTAVRLDARGHPHARALNVTFPITEGPQTFLEEVGFEGNTSISSAELATALELHLGVPLSYSAVEESRLRLMERYREEGYAFVRVELVVDRSPDHTRARVRALVREGPRVRVGHVEVRGHVLSAESMIRARLTLRPGDWYRVSEVQSSQRRLNELGVFSGVNIALDDPSLEAPVKNLVVQVVERPAQSLEARGGYSTGEGFRAGFDYAYQNLFGGAVSLSLGARVGYLVLIPGITPEFPREAPPSASDLVFGRAAISLGFPYIPFAAYGFGATVDLSYVRVLQPPFYALSTGSLGVTLLNRTLRTVTFSLTPEFQIVEARVFGASSFEQLRRTYNDRCLVTPGSTLESCAALVSRLDQALQRFSNGASQLFGLRFGVSVDRRNSTFTPTRGWFASFGAEWLNVLATEDPQLSTATMHFTGRVTGYVPLRLGDMVLMLSLRAGYNLQLADQSSTHPSRRFWLGGADSMRGWIQNQLVPQEIADRGTSMDATNGSTYLSGNPGGEFFYNAVADLRLPTRFCPFGCVAFAAFIDVGNLWLRVPTLSDLTRVRFSPGVGLRLASPFGMIALDFGFNPLYRKELGEQLVAFQFSLGAG